MKKTLLFLVICILSSCTPAARNKQKYDEAISLYVYKITHITGVEYSAQYIPRLQKAVRLLEEILKTTPDDAKVDELLERCKQRIKEHKGILVSHRRKLLEELKIKLELDEIPYDGFDIDADGFGYLDLSGSWESRHDNNSLADISFLKRMPIKTLELSNTAVKDLSPLKGMPLSEIHLNSTPVSDISPLTGMKLEYIDLYHTRVKDLSPLKGMPLVTVNIPRSVSDLTPLKSSPIVYFNVYLESKLLELDFLKEMKTIKVINGVSIPVFFNNWRLRKIEMQLRYSHPRGIGGGIVNVGEKRLQILACRERVTDISPVKGLKLEVVNLWKNDIKDISVLRDMPLKALTLYSTYVTDLSPVKGMPLEFLHIGNNYVTDYSPLEGLPLKTLRLWGCRIKDISFVRGMPLKELDISDVIDGKIRDLTPLEGLELEDLDFDPNPVKKGIEIIRNMKSLKKINRKSPKEFWAEYDALAPIRNKLLERGIV